MARRACLLLAMGAALVASAEASAPAPVPVRVARAAPAPDAGQIIVSGTITYKREQVLSFKTGGVVHRYAVDAGDTVRKGDPLVSADPSDTAGRRAEAEAAFAAAKANLDRVTTLHASGAESTARLDDARTTFQRASSALASARFDESRWLHQVVTGDHAEPRVWEDIPDFLASRPTQPWRCHFHVPVDRDDVEGLDTTAGTIPSSLDMVRGLSGPCFVEVETYAWSRLPEVAAPSLAEGVAREVLHARALLARAAVSADA